MSALPGDGCVGTSIVAQGRVGTQSLPRRVATTAFAQAFGLGRFSSRDLFAVHGLKSPFFGNF